MQTVVNVIAGIMYVQEKIKYSDPISSTWSRHR
jgi:hypothetical protein